MKPIEVIESKRWINSQTGATASVYGAVPYTTESEKSEWSVEPTGFTLRMSNGTIGFGRPPFKTRDEAIACMENWIKRLENV